MYSHDSVGLGHMRRNSNIAGRLVDETPAASALMVIGCPTGVFFDLPAGVDCLKLPSVQKVATNTWQPRHLKIPVAQARALRASLIEQTVEIMQPRVLLVDHMPGGVWGEIVPALRAAREVDDPPKIVLGLRDILDRPEVVRATWEADGLYDLIAECYDGILIYGQRDVFDTAAAYGLDGTDMPAPVYCGYIGSEAPVVDAATLRARRGIGSGDFVVVTAGGGADAFPMMAASMQALAALDPGERPYALFITGPLMAPADRAELRQAAAALPAEVVDVVTDLPSYLNAADLVVTMGGYNTLIEAIRLNKRAIVIPRTGPSAEQRLRAELLDGLGIVKALMPEDVAPGRLARLVKDVLEGPPPAVGLEINGLETAVDYLSTMLCEGTEYVTSSAKVQAAV